MGLRPSASWLKEGFFLGFLGPRTRYVELREPEVFMRPEAPGLRPSSDSEHVPFGGAAAGDPVAPADRLLPLELHAEELDGALGAGDDDA